MNGAQDLGGTMGFGPVRPEPDEPPFHAPWEKRALALTLAAGYTGQWNIDASRFARESMPPVQYLASSYYEIWLDGLARLLVERGLVTAQELAAGVSLGPSKPGVASVPAAAIPAMLARGGPTERTPPQPAHFAIGDPVRTRVMNPSHHTRLPRYLRGKRGRILRIHGAHVFPDTNAHFLGEQPAWLYTVCFDAVELWGPDTSADAICADCWEPYLESDPAAGASAAAEAGPAQ